ncbi:hypothetical protein BDF21DRAFT_452396 [Thamnidium elegans]|nr:hypothetical protein BDF21DRAFT_452396 [Thamnidium elegans]
MAHDLTLSQNNHLVIMINMINHEKVEVHLIPKKTPKKMLSTLTFTLLAQDDRGKPFELCKGVTLKGINFPFADVLLLVHKKEAQDRIIKAETYLKLLRSVLLLALFFHTYYSSIAITCIEI